MSKKYIATGTVKTIDLNKSAFTLEPLSAYRFQIKDGDESAYAILFKEVGEDDETEEAKDVKFVCRNKVMKFNKVRLSDLIILKQNKTKIKVLPKVKYGSMDFSKDVDIVVL